MCMSTVGRMHAALHVEKRIDFKEANLLTLLYFRVHLFKVSLDDSKTSGSDERKFFYYMNGSILYHGKKTLSMHYCLYGFGKKFKFSSCCLTCVSCSHPLNDE